MIDEARGGVAISVNASLTLLYWRIGQRIQVEILTRERTEYGKEILATPSQQLTTEGSDIGISGIFIPESWVN